MPSGLKKLLIAMRNGMAFRKHTGATFVSLLQSAWQMHKDDDIMVEQVMGERGVILLVKICLMLCVYHKSSG